MLTLLVTSDVHGGIAENYTLASVYEKKEYESNGDYTLLIDDGDTSIVDFHLNIYSHL